MPDKFDCAQSPQKVHARAETGSSGAHPIYLSSRIGQNMTTGCYLQSHGRAQRALQPPGRSPFLFDKGTDRR